MAISNKKSQVIINYYLWFFIESAFEKYCEHMAQLSHKVALSLKMDFKKVIKLSLWLFFKCIYNFCGNNDNREFNIKSFDEKDISDRYIFELLVSVIIFFESSKSNFICSL